MIFGHFFAPAYQRRRDDWFREVADAIDKQFPDGQFDWAAASQDEGFVSAVFSATQAAIRDSSEEKRRYLRNALLRVAAGKGPPADQQATFFRISEDLSASHVRLLDFFWRATQLLNEKVNLSTRYGNFLHILQEVDPDLAEPDGIRGDDGTGPTRAWANQDEHDQHAVSAGLASHEYRDSVHHISDAQTGPRLNICFMTGSHKT